MSLDRRAFLAASAAAALTPADLALAGAGGVLVLYDAALPPPEDAAGELRRLEPGAFIDPDALAAEIHARRLTGVVGRLQGANHLLVSEAIRAAGGAVLVDRHPELAARF